MGDGGEQRRAQSLGLGDPLDPVHLLDQPHALDRERALIQQRVQEPPLIGGEHWARLVAVDAHHADGAAAGMHRQEQAFRAGQRIGAAAGRAVILPRPFRRGEIGIVENIFRRVAGFHGDGATLGKQQHDPHFQHERSLISRGPQHVVERSGSGKLAAERVERFGHTRPLGRRIRLRAAASGNAGHDDGHEREKAESHDVSRIGDRERVDRRQEEEIVGDGGRDARQQRRQQAEANRDRNDCGQENEIDIADADPPFDQFAETECEGYRDQCRYIGPRIDRIVALGGAHRFLRNRRAGHGVAGDDVNADIAGAANQIVDHRAVQNLEPAGARRFADDDLGDVVGLRVADHVVGNVPVAGRQRDGLAAKRLGEAQRVGDAVALFVRKLQAAPALDIERQPWAMQTIRQPLGVAHQPGAARVLADADQNAFARRPWALDGVRLHFGEQLLVDAVGGAAQSEFAQRREIGRRKEMLERALGLPGDVDFSFFQSLDQIVRRQVDQFDGVGAIEHRVRHRLAHAHMGDLRHHVVEAFDVLDVDGGVDVDAVAHQLFDVEIAFRVAAAFGVGVRELIDQHDLRMPGDDGIEVHFLERLSFIVDVPARNDLQPGQQRFGVLAAVGLDDADDDVVAVFFARMGLLQHLVGLADAGRRADENSQFADTPLFAARRFEQGFRRGPMFGYAPLIRHH